MSITKLFHKTGPSPVLRENSAGSFYDSEVLLVLFTVGALAEVLFEKRVSEIMQRIVASESLCVAGLLVIDSFVACAPLGCLILPLTTLCFGLFSASETSLIVQGDLIRQWPRLAWLMFVIALHFVIGTWGLHTAYRVQTLLRHKGKVTWLYGLSLVCMILGWIGCFLTLYLARCAHI